MKRNQKSKYKKYYEEWQRLGSYCPALKCDIVVSKKGWNHLIGHGKKGLSKAHQRTGSDVCRRLKLLPVAKEMIENANTFQKLSKNEHGVFYVIQAMKLITIKGSKIWTRVEVVIQEDPIDYVRRFLSVSDSKVV